MSRLLGKTEIEAQGNYEVEFAEEWEHRCEPPMSPYSARRDQTPILHTGQDAMPGTRWRCGQCGTRFEVVAPAPGRFGRKWIAVAALDGGQDDPT